MQKLLDGGFIQSVKMVVGKVGFAADPRVRSWEGIAVATAPSTHPSTSSNPDRPRVASSTRRSWSTVSRWSG